MPEPQMPIGGASSMVRTCTVLPRIRTASTAPGAARMPVERWAPSKAGPEGEEQVRRRPPCSSVISVLVPMSTASTVPARRSSPVPSSMAT